ncbi:MAG: hypothetical protein Q9219_007520, partial [cf. Caloplaca sp. 3 TL-2023]
MVRNSSHKSTLKTAPRSVPRASSQLSQHTNTPQSSRAYASTQPARVSSGSPQSDPKRKRPLIEQETEDLDAPIIASMNRRKAQKTNSNGQSKTPKRLQEVTQHHGVQEISSTGSLTEDEGETGLSQTQASNQLAVNRDDLVPQDFDENDMREITVDENRRDSTSTAGTTVADSTNATNTNQQRSKNKSSKTPSKIISSKHSIQTPKVTNQAVENDAENPPPVPNRKSTHTDDVLRKFATLMFECRVMFLRYGNLKDYPSIIRAVWGDKISEDDWEWQESKKRIRWHDGNWKPRTIDRMIAKVQFYIEEDPPLAQITNLKVLVFEFSELYSPSTYSHVFDFANAAVDIAASEAASKHARIFFRSCFANLAARCKLHLDWLNTKNRPEEADFNRYNLLEWYTTMSLSTQYEVNFRHFIRATPIKPRLRKRLITARHPDKDPDYYILDDETPIAAEGEEEAEEAAGLP